jgi:4-hydroxyacetophenone monooxygenase
MFAGPNGAPRAGGHYTFAELWTRYVTRCLVKLLERGHHTLEVKQDVYERYNAELDDASKRMIWSHAGQGGYYLNEYGRSGFIMPWRISAFYERLVAPHEDDFTER